MKKVLFLLLLLVFSFSLYSQSDSFSEGGIPLEYEEDEFPKGVEDFRRFEQIFIGAFPFSIFFAQILGGIGLAIEDLAVTSQTGQPSSFSFGVENYRFDDKVRIIASGVGISFGIAVIDMIIYQVKLKEQANKYKRRKVLTKALSNKVVDVERLGEGGLLTEESTPVAQDSKNSIGVPLLPDEAFIPNGK